MVRIAWQRLVLPEVQKAHSPHSGVAAGRAAGTDLNDVGDEVGTLDRLPDPVGIGSDLAGPQDLRAAEAVRRRGRPHEHTGVVQGLDPLGVGHRAAPDFCRVDCRNPVDEKAADVEHLAVPHGRCLTTGRAGIMASRVEYHRLVGSRQDRRGHE